MAFLFGREKTTSRPAVNGAANVINLSELHDVHEQAKDNELVPHGLEALAASRDPDAALGYVRVSGERLDGQD